MMVVVERLPLPHCVDRKARDRLTVKDHRLSYIIWGGGVKVAHGETPRFWFESRPIISGIEQQVVRGA